MNNDDMTKPKTSKLAIASAVSLLIAAGAFGLFILILNITEPSEKMTLVEYFFAILFFGGMPLSTALGLVALLKIEMSDGQLLGKRLAVGITALSTFAGVILFGPPQGQVRPISQRIVCSTRMKDLYSSLQAYAEDHNDNLPMIQNWCDILICETDMPPKWLACPSSNSEFGESSYAFNKHLVNMKFSAIPPDVVLLFETDHGLSDSDTRGPFKARDSWEKYRILADYFGPDEKVFKDRWNQATGPGNLTTAYHYSEGCNIVFADGQVRWVKLQDLPNIRWSIDDPNIRWLPEEGQLPPLPNLFAKMLPLIAGTVAVTICGILLRYLKRKEYRVFAIILGVLSAGVGALFGCISEGTMYYILNFKSIGPTAGATLGLFAGLGYTIALSILCERNCFITIPQRKNHIKYGVLLGIVAGMISGVLVHITLIIGYSDFSFMNLMTGIYFGLAVGAGMGSLASNAFSWAFLTKAEGINLAKSGGQ